MKSPEEVQAIKVEVSEKYGIVFPNVELEPLWYGRREKARVDGRFAIVDQNTGIVFNVCTEAYRPVPHELIVKNLEDAALAHPEFGKPDIKVQLLADGGKIIVTAEFPEVTYEVKKGDILNPNIAVKSSYDLGWKYGFEFGAFRLVCSNGLKVGEVFDSFKKRHLQTLDTNILSNSLGDGMLRFSEQTELWQKWANTRVLDDVYSSMWEVLPFSKAEKEKIEQTKAFGSSLLLPEALKSGDLNVWDFYNMTTQYLTHDVDSELRKVDTGTKITNIFEKYF